MNYSNCGVFELITELCRITERNAEKKVQHKKLMANMRTKSYSLLLSTSNKELHTNHADPVVQLLSYYHSLCKRAQNVGEFKRAQQLKKILEGIQSRDQGDVKESMKNTLKLLVCLADTVETDLSNEMYNKPFTFGLMDEMLPKPPREHFGSPVPYPYYPEYIFKLPFSLNRQEQARGDEPYTVENFDSSSFLPDKLQPNDMASVKIFQSPMSMLSLKSLSNRYSTCSSLDFPRLKAPRNVKIPPSESIKEEITQQQSETSAPMEEVYRAECPSVWDEAARAPPPLPLDLWDRAALAPPPARAPIAASARETALWLRAHRSAAHAVVDETQLIRDLLFLIIGVESKCFLYDESTCTFRARSDAAVCGVSRRHLRGYAGTFLLLGTYYRRLYNFAFDFAVEDRYQECGLVFQAARDAVRKYLLDFRLQVTSLWDNGAQSPPTLLQLLHHIEPLKYQMEIIASVYRMADMADVSRPLPRGAALLSHLFAEAALVSSAPARRALCRALLASARVYFGFIDRFIFAGELSDACGEFFVQCDGGGGGGGRGGRGAWHGGCRLAAAPAPLRPLAGAVLLCGKSLRLLKMCNPTDPLLLLSADHPPIQCCTSFAKLEEQRRLLQVYRTRCRYVCGDGGCFARARLRRRAQRRACAELAAARQAETMDKIVAERKRLAQLMVVEKQHSLRALEAARAEARARRLQSSRRERLRGRLEGRADAAAEEVDAGIRRDESEKIMEYYTKLNMEVEKSTRHTEWKMRRLALDRSRVQLLSTEERNLKRERMEMQHQRTTEEMSMSTRSDNFDAISTASEDVTEDKDEETVPKSTAMFTAICNVAKNFFLGANTDELVCDNAKDLDSQGNVVDEINSNRVESETVLDGIAPIESKTSSDVIGQKISDETLNEMFAQSKQQAMQNKLKVMQHEYGRTDNEQNHTTQNNNIQVDEENNLKNLTPHEEARRNKKKVLGDEFNLPTAIATPASQGHTDAQREAIQNKHRVMNVECSVEAAPRQPVTTAQHEAVRNREKVLGSESVRGSRGHLTLDLKVCAPAKSSGVTPNAGNITPLVFTPRLDLETPTTSEVPLDEGPLSPGGSVLGRDSKHFASKGFDFSIIDEALEENMEQQEVEDTPLAPTDLATSHEILNLIDGSYDLEHFDPLGVKPLNGDYAKNYFGNKMDAEMAQSCYTNPSAIWEEVQKKPYADIFRSDSNSHEDDDDFECDNIATLTVCLQRSVLLPLTYQLEVVNNSILTYFLVNLDLYSHFKSLKDYFFLMDGEFSRSICNSLFEKLEKTTNPQELLNFATLHNILDNALGSSISHVHKCSERLSFTMSPPPATFALGSPAVLSCLSLAYQVEWPLNILLSPEAMARYSRVFQFLVKMRRVGWVLARAFESLKLDVRLASAPRALFRAAHYRAAQAHRHAAAALVRALDTYLAGCVLDAWRELDGDLTKARTLDDLYDCHVIYVKKVLFRCLLNNRSAPVMKLLEDIFTVVLKYCRVLRAGEWTQCQSTGAYTHSHYAQLAELHRMFEQLVRYLRKVVARLMECGYQRHLAELMTLVNLNEYYGPQCGGVTSASGVMSP